MLNQIIFIGQIMILDHSFLLIMTLYNFNLSYRFPKFYVMKFLKKK